MDKLVYTATVLTRMVGRIALITFAAVFGVLLFHLSSGLQLDLVQGFMLVVRHPLYQLVLALALVLNARLIIFRSREKDTSSR